MTSEHSGNEVGREASELVMAASVLHSASHRSGLAFYSAVSRSLSAWCLAEQRSQGSLFVLQPRRRASYAKNEYAVP